MCITIDKMKNTSVSYKNKLINKEWKNPDDDDINILYDENIYLFEAFSTGDFEEQCFAVTPKTYEFITGKEPYLDLKGERILVSENPFYEGYVSLYIYEMTKNPLFENRLEDLNTLLSKDGRVMMFINR